MLVPILYYLVYIPSIHTNVGRKEVVYFIDKEAVTTLFILS
jgi:hypothetical protein